MEQAYAYFDYDKTISFAKPLYEKKGDTTALRILGECYWYKEMPDSALFYFNESHQRGLKIDEELVARAYKKNGNWNKAISNYTAIANKPAKTFCELKRDNKLNCANSNSGNSLNECYEFDASESLDPERPDIIFNWKLGDGTQKTGIKVEHCYTKPGEYQVEFYVYDTLTHKKEIPTEHNLGMPNPYTLIVEPNFTVNMSTDSRKKIGKRVKFEVANKEEGASYLWDMGDGAIYDGDAIEHKYLIARSFNLKVYQLNSNGEVSGCTGTEVVISGNLRWLD